MADLERRIKARTEAMLQSGWIEEARRLFDTYPGQTIHPLDSVGYRQIRRYLAEELSYDQLVAEIVLRTRQYAKRQMQWFRHEPLNLEINPADFSSLDAIVEHILERWREDQERP